MPHEDVLGIGTGIETGLAASILFGVPAWATLNDGLLEKWTPPPGLKVVYVFGDNDVSFSGQASAFVLARALKHRDKDLTVIVEIPPQPGTDWADVLEQKRKAA